MEKEPANLKKHRKEKASLSLLDEFLEEDDHFQGGKYDKPIHLRKKESASQSYSKTQVNPPKTAESSINASDALKNELTVPSTQTPTIDTNATKCEQSGSKVVANSEQSDSKVVANLEQSDSKVVANLEQSGSKVVANLEQSGSKNQRIADPIETSSKVIANWEQSDSKVVANQEQSDSKVVANQEQSGSSDQSVPTQSGSKVVAKLVAEVVANWEQSGSKLTSNISFSKLSGIQRNITIFIYEECKRLRSKITDEISMYDLSKIAETDSRTAKNGINRLIQKSVIRRYEFKDGRAGWTRYELAENIYQDIRDKELSGRLIEKWEQSGSKVVAKLVAEPIANSPSSSRSYVSEDFKSTTTEPKSDKPQNDLAEEWLQIDITPLNDIKFDKNHLRQWFTRNYCNAQEAQESINHYAYYLKHLPAGQKPPESKIAYLMSCMARDKYFARPDGYLSPEERMRKKRAEDEQKALLERRKLQEDHFEVVFEKWIDLQPGGLIKQLAPGVKTFDHQKAIVKELFRDQHWLNIRDNPDIDVSSLSLSLEESPLPEKPADLAAAAGQRYDMSPQDIEKAKAEQIRRFKEFQASQQN